MKARLGLPLVLVIGVAGACSSATPDSGFGADGGGPGNGSSGGGSGSSGGSSSGVSDASIGTFGEGGSGSGGTTNCNVTDPERRHGQGRVDAQPGRLQRLRSRT